MSGHVPVRGGSHLRRGSGVRRASAGLSLTRLAALALLLGTVVVLDQLVGATFAIRSIETRGAELTDVHSVEAALLEVPPAQDNVFRYDTAAAAARVAGLPTVRRAVVRAIVPDRLVAIVEERVAVLTWVVGERRFLVDDEGLLFALAAVAEEAAPPVIDLRARASTLRAGDRLSAVDLRVARQLSAVTSDTIGSAAASLTLRITDEEGFVLAAEPGGWTAVFGLYGEVVRTPDIAPLQVQCLAALLADRGEEAVGRVVLSVRDQLCGTFDTP